MEKHTFTTKLHESCGDDDLRPILMCVHFANGYAYATNGHIIVKQSLKYHSILDPERLNGKSIHKDNYKAVMQFETCTCDDSGISCQNLDGRTAFFEYFDRGVTEMPEFDRVMAIDQYKETDVPFIGINPEFFFKLSKSMHSIDGSFRLRFQGLTKAIIVDCIGIDDQYGIIMPIVLNDTLFS